MTPWCSKQDSCQLHPSHKISKFPTVNSKILQCNVFKQTETKYYFSSFLHKSKLKS